LKLEGGLGIEQVGEGRREDQEGDRGVDQRRREGREGSPVKRERGGFLKEGRGARVQGTGWFAALKEVEIHRCPLVDLECKVLKLPHAEVKVATCTFSKCM